MNKEKLHITKIFRGPQETKFGTKDKIAFKCTQYGDKWVSSFKTQGTENWKESDEVEVFIEKKGEFVNFTLQPTAGSEATAAVSALEARVKKLEDFVFGNKAAPVATAVVPDEDNW